MCKNEKKNLTDKSKLSEFNLYFILSPVHFIKLKPHYSALKSLIEKPY
jgi:hypothetical protein